MSDRDVCPNVAAAAALIADPSRAAMLWSLMGRQSRPASELARIAGLSAQAASAHLARLVDGGMLDVTPRGRHRFYRLADETTASLIESLAGWSATRERPVISLVPVALRTCRRCWGHMAGRAAVALHDRLLAAGWIERREQIYAVTDAGVAGFTACGVDPGAVRPGRRGLLFPCLDWSERRDHLGGPMATAMLDRFLGAGWVVEGGKRALTLTPAGERGLALIGHGERRGVTVASLDDQRRHAGLA